METRVLLLRHGKTSDPDRFHGAESDVGLSERGLRQSSVLARHLVDFRPAALYCSGMRRALETARPIAEACGLLPETVADLHEWRMGAISGRNKEEARAVYAGVMKRWAAGERGYKPEGAESYAEIEGRVRQPFEDLVDLAAGRTIVIVSHGMVIRVLFTSLFGIFHPKDLRQIRVDTGAFNDLRRTNEIWNAKALNVRPPRLR